MSEAIKTIALQRRRFGYRRVHDLLRTAHPGVNHKRVYRLYRAADLAARKRAKAKRPVGARTPLVAASYVNVLAETINGLYKAEVIHRREPWKTKQAVELATQERVAWFNHDRPMGHLGYIPPAEFEANCHRPRAGQAATV